jgi:monofunctional biosynthetic peptidoglycan transglycosylase
MRRFLRRTLAALPTLMVLGGAAFLLWWHRPVTGLEAWRSGPPPERWALWRQTERRLRAEGRPPGIDWSWVPLEEVSLPMQAAVVVAEDIGFFHHAGIDWTAVREALQEWRNGKGLRGASTITQQLAKNLFLTGERSFLRKLQEARLARALERELGKKRILELYLNCIEFGDARLGVEAAARYYYGVSAARLDPVQAAGLAAAIPSPRRDNPASRTRTWSFREAEVTGRLSDIGWLERRLLRLFPDSTAARLLAARVPPDTTEYELPPPVAIPPDTTGIPPTPPVRRP